MKSGRRLHVIPISIKDANCFVEQVHRHHDPAQHARFAIACARDMGPICGVAIVGDPAARMLDDGWTAEVRRVATDGTRNACSFLYGRAWRVAQQLGYRRLITYTLAEESGASLRAAGWSLSHVRVRGGSWSRDSRPRVDHHPLQAKLRWEAPA